MKLTQSWLLSFAQFSMLTMVVLGTSSIYSAAMTSVGAGAAEAPRVGGATQAMEELFTQFFKDPKSPWHAGNLNAGKIDLKALEATLEAGADVNNKSGAEGLTPLGRVLVFREGISGCLSSSVASKFSNPEDFVRLVEMLIKHGANRSVRIASGQTPLHVAVRLNIPVAYRLRIVNALLNGFSAADAWKKTQLVNTTDSQGYTPLMRAVELRGCGLGASRDEVNNVPVIQSLLTANPDPTIVRSHVAPHNQTVVSRARALGHALLPVLAQYEAEYLKEIKDKITSGVPGDPVRVILGDREVEIVPVQGGLTEDLNVLVGGYAT